MSIDQAETTPVECVQFDECQHFCMSRNWYAWKISEQRENRRTILE